MRHSNECLIYIAMAHKQKPVYSKDEYISGESLYQYLHISKRKMKYLLENGYIPYIDTGKKTYRYIVRISDVEEFKRRLATDSELSAGICSKFSSQRMVETMSQLVAPTQENSRKLKYYLLKKWADEPDAIHAKRVAELVGFQSQRIYTLCDQKRIFSVRICDKVYCSKESVIDHFASVERLSRPYVTEGYSKLIREFMEQNI